MRKRYLHYIIMVALLLCVALPGCGRKAPVAADPVKIHRLDSLLASGEVMDNDEMWEAAKALFAVSGYGELTDSSLAVYNANPSITYHAGTVAERMADMSAAERDFGRLAARMHELLPGVKFPTVYAVISPFNQSVFTVDSMLFLGVNHYLGADYEPYGYFPDFVRLRKVPVRMDVDVAETLVRRAYPFEPGSDYPTVLSRLLYEGAVTEAIMQLTGKEERSVLGYDSEEMKWLEDNEKEAWNALITRKMLYSTDETVAHSLVVLSGVTSSLHPDAPGMAGRFIGHRIVREYLKHNDSGLEELLSPSFYNSELTLAKSRYH